MATIQIDYDKLKRANWTEQEQSNVKMIIDFIQNLMNNHDFDYVSKTFGHQNYTQHNRAIPDGIPNLIDYVKDFAKRFPDYCYDVKHIYADGDSVIFHSHATIKANQRGNDAKGLNIIDVWRIGNGEISEHWDALQAMDGFMRFYNLMTGGRVKNGNGVY